MPKKRVAKPKKKITILKRIFSHPLGQGSLKDFFIPHHGNNHQPKALHPKRALFHISAALIVKAIVMMFVLNYPITAWMSPDVSATEGKKIISLTNNVRSNLSLATLAESQKLNQAAYNKVQDMFINQYFAHHSPAGMTLEIFARQAGYTNYSVLGENLAVGYRNATEVMTAWQNSPSHYHNLVDPNYREIGVSVAGGQYKDKDTVFIAQYFGVSKTAATPAPSETPKKDLEKVVKDSEPTVLSEKTTPPTPTKVVAPPKIISKTSKVTSPPKPAPKTTVVVSKPVGKPLEKVVKITATLPVATTAASANILNHTIALEPKADGNWRGQDIIVSEKGETTVVPPSLTVNDATGAATTTDLSADSIIPEKSSLLEQYQLYRSHPNNWLGQIFNLSTLYYKIILGVALAALCLNIFMAKGKQHAHLIASGIGVIASMVFLIVF